MQERLKMTRVVASNVQPGRPLPYAIFTLDGAMIGAPGARILNPQKIEILRRQGWRQSEDEESTDSATEQSDGPETPSLQIDAPPVVPIREAVALVADDMELARSLLTRILTEQGVKRVVAVEDGRQAITRYFIESPNLVFLDIDMPKLDGLSALKQIKSWSPNAFVCLVSANSTQVNVRVALEHKVDAFLVKPYTILNLRRILARYQPSFAETPG